jgi:hypothetical protein
MKGNDGINDLDAPLAASVGRPIGNNATKTNTLEAMWTKKIQSSINKCIVDVSLNLLIRDKKDEEWWATLLQKQEEKMRIKKERVVVKKRRVFDALDRLNGRNGSPGSNGRQLLQSYNLR